MDEHHHPTAPTLPPSHILGLPNEILGSIFAQLKPKKLPWLVHVNQSEVFERIIPLDNLRRVCKTFKAIAEPLRWETFVLGVYQPECGMCGGGGPCELADGSKVIAPGLKYLCCHPKMARYVRDVSCWTFARVPLSCVLEAYSQRAFHDFIDTEYSPAFCRFFRVHFDTMILAAASSRDDLRQNAIELALVLLLTVAPNTHSLFYQLPAASSSNDGTLKVSEFFTVCGEQASRMPSLQGQERRAAPLSRLQSLTLQCHSRHPFDNVDDPRIAPFLSFPFLENLWVNELEFGGDSPSSAASPAASPPSSSSSPAHDHRQYCRNSHIKQIYLSDVELKHHVLRKILERCCDNDSLESLFLDWADPSLSGTDFHYYGDALRTYGTNLRRLDWSMSIWPERGYWTPLGSLRMHLTQLTQLQMPLDLLLPLPPGYYNDDVSPEREVSNSSKTMVMPELADILPASLRWFWTYSTSYICEVHAEYHVAALGRLLAGVHAHDVDDNVNNHNTGGESNKMGALRWVLVDYVQRQAECAWDSDLSAGMSLFMQERLGPETVVYRRRKESKRKRVLSTRQQWVEGPEDDCGCYDDEAPPLDWVRLLEVRAKEYPSNYSMS